MPSMVVNLNGDVCLCTGHILGDRCAILQGYLQKGPLICIAWCRLFQVSVQPTQLALSQQPSDPEKWSGPLPSKILSTPFFINFDVVRTLCNFFLHFDAKTIYSAEQSWFWRCQYAMPVFRALLSSSLEVLKFQPQKSWLNLYNRLKP